MANTRMATSSTCRLSNRSRLRRSRATSVRPHSCSRKSSSNPCLWTCPMETATTCRSAKVVVKKEGLYGHAARTTCSKTSDRTSLQTAEWLIIQSKPWSSSRSCGKSWRTCLRCRCEEVRVSSWRSRTTHRWLRCKIGVWAKAGESSPTTSLFSTIILTRSLWISCLRSHLTFKIWQRGASCRGQ